MLQASSENRIAELAPCTRITYSDHALLSGTRGLE